MNFQVALQRKLSPELRLNGGNTGLTQEPRRGITWVGAGVASHHQIKENSASDAGQGEM